MRFIFRLLFASIAVLGLAYVLPGVHVESITVSLFVAIVLVFLNAFLKPLLILFTIPLTILTLGLFLLVINAAIILFADFLVDGFEVDNFWWALLFSLLLSLAISFYEAIAKGSRKWVNYLFFNFLRSIFRIFQIAPVAPWAPSKDSAGARF